MSWRRGLVFVGAAVGAIAVAIGGATAWRAIATEQETWGEDHVVSYTPRWPWSAEKGALRSLARAQDVQVVALEPWMETFSASSDQEAEDECAGRDCVAGNTVLGRVPLSTPADRAAVAGFMDGWLAMQPDFGAACSPLYHHAVVWQDGGSRHELLLCYGCGIHELHVDGKRLWSRKQGARIAGQGWLNARFARAGIRYYDESLKQWIPGRGEAVAR